MRSLTYSAIDVETTGLPRRGDWSGVYLTEIGGVDVEAGVVRRVWHTLVRLPADADYPEHVQRLTGIPREACDRHGVSLRQALAMLAADDARQLVGHNIYGFDLDALHAAYSRCGMPLEVNAWVNDLEPLDTMLLWRAHRLGLARRPWEPVPVFMGRCRHAQYWGGSALSDVAEALGVEVDERARHRAADDAWTCAHVLMAMARDGILEEVLG